MSPFVGLHPSSRSVLVWVFLLYLIFVIYGSLVPLQYVDRSWGDAVRAFQRIPFLSVGIDSRADWVANLLLFIPLAFLAAISVQVKGGWGRRLLTIALLAGAASLLAVAIEFTQLFFPQRTVSQNDIVAEGIGALVGLALYGVLGERFEVWFDGFWHRQRQHDRVVKLLQAYLMTLLFFSVLPLDLTLSPVDIFHKWKEGRVVLLPFSGLKGDWSQAVYETATDIGIWIPVGMLWTLKAQITARRVMLMGLGAATVIEFLQLFVYSRVSDLTDIMLAGAGAVTGWALVKILGYRIFQVVDWLDRYRPALWGLWAMLTVGVFWFPFNFNGAGLNESAAIAAFTRVPFSTYYFTTEFHAINELLRKMGFFLPGGLLLGLRRVDVASLSRYPNLLPLGLLVCFSFGIETGQLALPGKFADLTDAVLESLGGALGYFMARWIAQPYAEQPRSTVVGFTRPRPSTLLPLTARPDSLGRKCDYVRPVVTLLALCLALGLLLNLPGMPYNVRELLSPGWGGAVGSVLGLSAVAYGMANGAFFLFTKKRRGWFLAFPALLVIQGVLAWLLLWLSVPQESLEDIVGAPVLDWPGSLEMAGRYVALHLSLVLQMVGSALLVRGVLNPSARLDFIYWVVVTTLLAWPIHMIVVEWAATDNLTELMRGQGSFLTSAMLAGAFFLTSLVGSATAAAFGTRQRVFALLAMAVAAAIGATGLFWAGAEHTIIKYDHVFSAFQFLLSTDRAYVPPGPALMLRYLAAFSLVSGSIAALQWSFWRDFCREIHVNP